MPFNWLSCNHYSKNLFQKRILFLIVGALFLCHFLQAQLCQGSLGAPIVNRTFGSGTNPGQPLGAAATSYPFVTNDCPNDGFYTIRNNTNNCFGGSWHNLTADHTGDAGGYFMLVNASLQPGSFYIDTVKGLCAGTTFEFAAWVMNVLNSSACGGNGTRPNLTFSIEKTDGVVLQQYATGDIANTASPQWNQYGFFFKTLAGITEVVLRITNNAPGGCGNDLALDDITFRPCGPLLTTSISLIGGNSATVCSGQVNSFTLNSAISNGYTNPVFQWQSNFNGGAFIDIAGAVNSSILVNFLANATAGIYSYRLLAAEAGNMANTGCRVISPLIKITIEERPITNIGSNSPLCANAELQIKVNSNGNAFNWTGPNGFTSTSKELTIANAQTNQSGRYYLLASTQNCNYNDSVTILINPVPIATINTTAITICETDTVQLIADGGTVYNWLPRTSLSSPTSAITKAYPRVNTNYSVEIKNNFNCADTVTTAITVIKKAKANAGPDLFAIAGTPVRLQPTSAGDNFTYTWTPPLYLDSIFILKPLVNAPAGEHIYKLFISSTIDCGFLPDEVKVTVYANLYIPTAFTPNKDGKNDRWRIPALSAFSAAEVFVYNRFGEIIFSEKGSFMGWDGTYKGVIQPSGTYIYVIKPGDPKQPPVLKGTVTLIR